MSADVQKEALALLQQGRAAEAADLLDGLPRDPKIDPMLGFALQLAGRLDDAAAAYGRSIAYSTAQLAGLHINQGQVLGKAGRTEEAATAYEAALALDPDNGVARMNLGACRHNQGRLEDAARIFREALDRDADDTEARANLGAALCGLGRFQEAEAELALASAAEGHHAVRAQAGLAAALAAQERYTEAIGVAQGAVARDPELGDAHEQLANAAISADQYELGLSAAEAACRLDESVTTQEMRGAALAGLMRMEEAAEAFRRAIELDPERAGPWRNLARICERIGQHDAAIEGYRKALAIEPDGPGEQSLAGVLARKGHVEEAVAILEKLAVREPDDASIRHTLDALKGAQPPAPPPGYVSGLFDDYAPRFEEHLVGHLDYRGHIAVAEALGAARVARALDVGCGTGLVGVALRPIAEHLTGIDVAPKMVETAQKKGVYDALEVADAVAYLAADGPRFDVVASADVLIYVGDPVPLFAAVGARLAPGGRFAFTIERSEGTWRLEPFARYSHDPGWLERLGAEHGMALAHQSDFVLRREMGKPVPGVVMVFRRE